MALVESLLTAIVRSDGDALVMHVGEKPYVVASAGPIELSRQGLNLGAMEGMLTQLLPAEALRALGDLGAIEHELGPLAAARGDRFTVVAARGGDDIWIELRRHRRLRPMRTMPVAAAAPAAPAVAPAPPAAVLLPVTALPLPVTESLPPVEAEPPQAAHVPEIAAEPGPVAAPLLREPETVSGSAEAPAVIEAPEAPVVEAPAEPPAEPPAAEPAPEEAVTPVAVPVAASPEPVTTPEPALPAPVPASPRVADEAPLLHVFAEALEAAQRPLDVPEPPVAAPAASARPEPARPMPVAQPMFTPPPASLERPVAPGPAEPPPAPVASLPAVPAAQAPPPPEAPFDRGAPRDRAAAPDATAVEPSSAVVLPLSRAALRSEPISRGGTAVRPGGIERLLRLAAARGASALYLTTQARPAVRVDGDIRLLDGEPPLSSGDVEAAVLELMPEGSREPEEAEWIRDLPEVGRVRITTFRDYRGPGALFRMISARATSAEQLGLVREIQALATEPEGLVIVTGPRGSGKSTLLAAFVDLINRQRNDYVITLEGQIRLVHESRGSLISQRELRGNADEVVAAARAALRENPDVLVIEDLRSPDVLRAALDAAGSGLLVFVSVTAASATAALERLVDLCPAEQRKTVRAALAEHLRGVVAQVLLRKAGGGRLAARELVLNTAAVAALVGDGQIPQLPRAIDSGRKHGMVPLNDALVAFVQSGAVDVREAYRRADDKAGLLTLLKREGIDTSFVERLA